MDLSKKNKQIFINQEALFTLSMVKEGLLGSFKKLMNKEEACEVRENGYLKNISIPIPIIFCPNGKKNQEVLATSSKNDVLDIVYDNKIVGNIEVNSTFQVNKKEQIFDIFGFYNQEEENSKKDFNSFAVSGSFDIKFNEIKKIKIKIKNTISSLNAKNVTASMMSFSPFNRAHERLIRTALDGTDLLVIFILNSRNNRLNYDLRKECMEYFVENFLPKEKIIIVPLKNTYIFSANSNPILECIVAKNFGCTKIFMEQSHTGIEMFFDKNQTKTILDKYRKKLPIEVVMMPEFTYCNICKTLVSIRTCPHGQHHHIKYSSNSLTILLENGIMPPAILMRRDISAIILSKLFPKRFSDLQALCNDMLPNAGLVKERALRDFYEELMELYQTSSLT